MYKELIAFLAIFISLSNKNETVIDKINSKNYCFDVTSKTSYPDNPSDSSSYNFSGLVFRDNNFYNLNSNKITCIFEDSLFVSINHVLKLISLGSIEQTGMSIIAFSDCPNDILKYAQVYKKKESIRKYKNRIEKTFKLIDLTAFKEISYTYWLKGDSISYFKVKLLYQQRNRLAQDDIVYKLRQVPNNFQLLKLSDVVKKVKGKFELNSNYQGFMFDNYIDLLKE